MRSQVVPLCALLLTSIGCATMNPAERALDYYSRGLEAAYDDRPDDAGGFFRESRAGGRALPGVHASIGILFYQAGDREAAIEAFKAEMAANPSALTEKILRALQGKGTEAEEEGGNP